MQQKYYICSVINNNTMEDRLVTTRTYADMHGVTTECVRKWARQGKIKSKVIDGVNFIVLTDEEMKQRKEAEK